MPSIARHPSANAIAATRVANKTARDVLNVSIAPPQPRMQRLDPLRHTISIERRKAERLRLPSNSPFALSLALHRASQLAPMSDREPGHLRLRSGGLPDDRPILLTANRCSAWHAEFESAIPIATRAIAWPTHRSRRLTNDVYRDSSGYSDLRNSTRSAVCCGDRFSLKSTS
jgi:hypothetical protein